MTSGLVYPYPVGVCPLVQGDAHGKPLYRVPQPAATVAFAHGGNRLTLNPPNRVTLLCKSVTIQARGLLTWWNERDCRISQEVSGEFCADVNHPHIPTIVHPLHARRRSRGQLQSVRVLPVLSAVWGAPPAHSSILNPSFSGVSGVDQRSCRPSHSCLMVRCCPVSPMECCLWPAARPITDVPSLACVLQAASRQVALSVLPCLLCRCE